LNDELDAALAKKIEDALDAYDRHRRKYYQNNFLQTANFPTHYCEADYPIAAMLIVQVTGNTQT